VHRAVLIVHQAIAEERVLPVRVHEALCALAGPSGRAAMRASVSTRRFARTAGPCRKGPRAGGSTSKWRVSTENRQTRQRD
jgi:hypothetical protein